jgi:hypothetical protein
MLETLAELANVPSFEGLARPVAASTTLEANEQYTPAPLVFEAPKVVAGTDTTKVA